MNILITGGAGFIGSHLTRFYLEKKSVVFAVDNLITGNKKNIEEFLGDDNFHFFEKDILTFDFRQFPTIDIIYHLASPASPIQYKKHPIETLLTNSLGTIRLLEFMKKRKSKQSLSSDEDKQSLHSLRLRRIESKTSLHSAESKKFVLASTSEVYGDPLEHPQKETYFGNVNPAGVRACYDEGKRFAEATVMVYFRRYNLDVRIARIFNTYGPNMEKDDGRVVSNFIVQALEKKPITVYGDGKQTRSFCFVLDMVDGLVKLGEKKDIAGQTVNLGNPNEKTVLELANLVKKLTASSSKIVFKPIGQDDPKKRRPDITKAKKLLGFQPKINLEDGLLETINYFAVRT